MQNRHNITTLNMVDMQVDSLQVLAANRLVHYWVAVSKAMLLLMMKPI